MKMSYIEENLAKRLKLQKIKIGRNNSISMMQHKER